MRCHHGVLALLALVAGPAWAQTPAMPPPHDPNDYPNSYHVQEGWAQLGRTFGGVSAVDMDPDGKSVWVFERCGKADDGCAHDKTLNPVMKFDASGKLVKSWGAGEFLYPHGIFVSRDRHIWLVEGTSQSGVVANVVREFTQDGKLLRTMGQERHRRLCDRPLRWRLRCAGVAGRQHLCRRRPQQQDQQPDPEI